MTGLPVLDRLHALADATRSRILLVLDAHELTVGELSRVLQLPQSTVSRHLRVLHDDGWVTARGDGTSRFYSLPAGGLEPVAARLWDVVRHEVADSRAAAQDQRRVESVLARRRSRSQEFFSGAAGAWDTMRAELIGARTDLLGALDLLDERWVVGDLGCGAGHMAAALAPCVRRVVAVDESDAMLAVARGRLTGVRNVDFHAGALERLPVETGALDAALLVLVMHHVAEPLAALQEARRVLRPGGKLVMVDLMAHDRAEYASQFGHIWPGFSAEQVLGWLRAAGFERPRHRALPADPAAQGPTLFSASGRASA